MGVLQRLSAVCLSLLATLLLLHGAVAAPVDDVSETPAVVSGLDRPHLYLALGDDRKMQEDIYTFYSAKHCPFDENVALLFKDTSYMHMPSLRSIAVIGARPVYNDIIILLSLIEINQWTDEMCRISLLGDLTSRPFCSTSHPELQMDRKTVMALDGVARGSVMATASSLQHVTDFHTCGWMCGPVPGLCNTFIVLAKFFVSKESAQLVQFFQDNKEMLSRLVSLSREQKQQTNSGGRQGGESPPLMGPLQPPLNLGPHQIESPPQQSNLSQSGNHSPAINTLTQGPAAQPEYSTAVHRSPSSPTNHPPIPGLTTKPEDSTPAFSGTTNVQQTPRTHPPLTANVEKSEEGKEEEISKDASGNSGDGGPLDLSNGDSAQLAQYLKENREMLTQLFDYLREQKEQKNGQERQGEEATGNEGRPDDISPQDDFQSSP